MSTPSEITLVTFEEAAAVAKIMHGPDAELLDYAVEKGTATVQGFLSNILRVSVRVKVGQQEVESKFIVKRQPVLEAQQKMTEEFGVFEHEIGVLEQCLPLLLARRPDLPVVRCYLADAARSVIYMEDLKESGFTSLVRNIVDLKDTVLQMPHLEVAMRTLAAFHAASVGVNWLQRFPHIFTEDIFFEKNDGAVMRNCIEQGVRSILRPIARHHFQNDAATLEAVEWIASDDFYRTVTAICKHDTTNAAVNVLCHGDSWANNMMFKLDPESGDPLQVKLIDFQISRYAPGNRDLVYCIYMVCTAEFRKQHEKELLQTYWQALSDACPEGPGQTWDEFYADYDRIRPFGLMVAATMRPAIYIEGAVPVGEEELTEEQITNMVEGRYDQEDIIRQFENNPTFHKEMVQVIEEAAQIYRDHKQRHLKSE
ncbi:uncharacterized protein LOC135945848 [Cloeon dipterum]|uniref:uncharacterized protein LOC135945848 n=1 Tax=Cloeon dipterum TaxID=197152 RepID=UPI0032206D0B